MQPSGQASALPRGRSRAWRWACSGGGGVSPVPDTADLAGGVTTGRHTTAQCALCVCEVQCPGATKEHRLTRARGESGGRAPGTLSTQLPVGTAPQRHRGTAQGKPGNSKPGDQDNSGAWCWARRPFGSRRRPVRRGGKSATQAQVLVSLQLSGPSTKRQVSPLAGSP